MLCIDAVPGLGTQSQTEEPVSVLMMLTVLDTGIKSVITQVAIYSQTKYPKENITNTRRAHNRDPELDSRVREGLPEMRNFKPRLEG